MLISELIAELQDKLTYYGNLEVKLMNSRDDSANSIAVIETYNQYQGRDKPILPCVILADYNPF
jgi:hypothetical protein